MQPANDGDTIDIPVSLAEIARTRQHGHLTDRSSASQPDRRTISELGRGRAADGCTAGGYQIPGPARGWGRSSRRGSDGAERSGMAARSCITTSAAAGDRI